MGLFGFNLVAALFGNASALSRAIYALVGLSAAWQLVSLTSALGRSEVLAERS